MTTQVTKVWWDGEKLMADPIAESEIYKPQQEPVAWTVAGQIRDWSKDFSAYKTQHYVQPVYTSPPQRTWVGLTVDEIYSVLENLQITYSRPPTTDSRLVFSRAIEAKLKEKNNGN